MIPNIDILSNEITKPEYPNRTYKVLFGDTDRISGYVDGKDAVIQSVYLILSSERYKHIIYSWDYGIELLDLYGKPLPYVMAVLPRRIKEALTQDNRIDDVVDFKFECNGNKLLTTFTVVSTVGEIPTSLEVTV